MMKNVFIQKSPDVVFWRVVLIFAAFWTIAPVFVIHNFRPDLMEMLLTGQNWVLATEKHGALTCWLVESIYVASGRALWSPYLTAQLCVVASLYGIYLTAKEFLPARRAILVPFCMLAYYFFHFESTLYNNHTTLAVFWIWSVFFYLKAVATDKTRWWIWTGVSLGLGIYCKMTIVFLILAILLFMASDGQARNFWRTRGPYLSTIVCFLIYLPLLLWNIRHDFVNFHYALGSASGYRYATPLRHLIAPINFLLEQLLYVLPISIPLIPFLFDLKRKNAGKDSKSREASTPSGTGISLNPAKSLPKETPKDKRGLFPIFFGPRVPLSRFDPLEREEETRRLQRAALLFIFVIPLTAQIVFSIKSGSPARGALGCHLWFFWPLLALMVLRPDDVLSSPNRDPNEETLAEIPSPNDVPSPQNPKDKSFQNALRWSLIVPGVIMILFILGVWLAPAIEGHASRYHYPGKRLGESVTQLWRERFHSPVPFVLGDEWLTQNVSIYSPDRPRLWDPQWATEEEFRRKGGVLLWEEGNEESMGRKREVEERFPYDGEIVKFTFRQQTRFDVPPAKVWVGFYPPADSITPTPSGESK